jgi:hypothetical protein
MVGSGCFTTELASQIFLTIGNPVYVNMWFLFSYNQQVFHCIASPMSGFLHRVIKKIMSGSPLMTELDQRFYHPLIEPRDGPMFWAPRNKHVPAED